MRFWRFHFENEIPIKCLFSQWKWTYIYWIVDLEGEVHSIWDLWISGFQECMGNGFFEVGRVAISFRSGPESMDFLDGRLPLPESTSPEKFRGGEGGL